MKINGPPSFHSLERVGRAETDRAAGGVVDGRQEEVEAVVLSDTARYIESLRDTASGMNAVRMGEVARARADIASGALDNEAEYQAAADAFLAAV